MAQPNGNWEGDAEFTIIFNKGGCCEFGSALLKAVHLGEKISKFNFAKFNQSLITFIKIRNTTMV